MATAADIRTRVYERLYSDFVLDRPFESLVNEALDNSETAVDVLDGNDWEENDILEVAETGERMLVLSVATNTLTVKRSYGTVAATAATDQGIIRKNPRFTQDQVDNAIRDVLNSMPGWGIHGWGTGSVTLVAGQHHYSLSETDIDTSYGVLTVYTVGTQTEIPAPVPFDMERHLSTTPTEWSAATGINIYDFNDKAAGDSMYYTYAQSLAYDTDLDTTLAKLPVQAEEVIISGALVRLLGGTVVPATQDPGQRTDRTVPPGQTARDVRHWQGEFFVQARLEAARLAVERQRVPRARRSSRARRWRW